MASGQSGYFTDEQYLKILRDNALFSETKTARFRAVSDLARRFDVKAISVIKEVINSTLDEDLRSYSRNIIVKIQEEKSHV